MLRSFVDVTVDVTTSQAATQNLLVDQAVSMFRMFPMIGYCCNNLHHENRTHCLFRKNAANVGGT